MPKPIPSHVEKEENENQGSSKIETFTTFQRHCNRSTILLHNANNHKDKFPFRNVALTAIMSRTNNENLLSRREKRGIFLSFVLFHCCHLSRTVSALQVQPRDTHSFFVSRSPVSLETTSTIGNKRRRKRNLSLSSSLNSQENELQDDVVGIAFSPVMNRRDVFSNSAKALFAGLATPFLLDPTDPANALLLRFPVDDPNTQPLKNRYHFLRAGTSELEMEGIYSTNPLFLTNRENALSDKGYEPLRAVVAALKKTANAPTVAYHSLAANGMDTGDYIARELKLGRDRLLPEFTYLDQRGIGLWDSNEEDLVRPAVWAMDKLEAGNEGFGGKPPANTDGTPNDNLHDQFTRLRQFLSLQETRTAGETILVIFPDGTGPALLSCMIAGIPFSEVHALEFKPGELRLDITVESIKELYETRKDDPAYLATIEDGKEKLKELRQMNAKDFSVSFKDSKAGEKEEEETRANNEQQEAAAAERRRIDEERRLALQEEIRLSKEKAREKEEQRKREQLAIKEKKEQKLREDRELMNKRKAEQQAKYVENKQKQEEAQRAAKEKYLAASRKSSEPSESSPSLGLSTPVFATAAIGAIGAVLLSGTKDDDENKDSRFVTTTKGGSDGDATSAEAATTSATTVEETPKTEIKASITTVETEELKKEKPNLNPIHNEKPAKEPKIQTPENDGASDEIAESTPVSVPVEREGPETKILSKKDSETDGSTLDGFSKEKEEEFTAKLQAAEQEMKDALIEAADVKKKKQQQQQSPRKKSSLFDNNPPVIVTKTTKTTNYVYDDDEDDSDWLRVLREIRDEEEEDDEDDDFGMVDYASMVDDAKS